MTLPGINLNEPATDRLHRLLAMVPWLLNRQGVDLEQAGSRLALLYDSTSQPLPHLQPGQRHDFTVRHDIKDLVSGLPGALCCAVPAVPWCACWAPL